MPGRLIIMSQRQLNVPKSIEIFRHFNSFPSVQPVSLVLIPIFRPRPLHRPPFPLRRESSHPGFRKIQHPPFTGGAVDAILQVGFPDQAGAIAVLLQDPSKGVGVRIKRQGVGPAAVGGRHPAGHDGVPAGAA